MTQTAQREARSLTANLPLSPSEREALCVRIAEALDASWRRGFEDSQLDQRLAYGDLLQRRK